MWLDVQFKMPPEGTTLGYRSNNGAMWVACNPAPDRKPGIAACDYPGNLLSSPVYKLVAVFESEADRDFVLDLHRQAVVDIDKSQ